jgi:penicillin-binding protein 2
VLDSESRYQFNLDDDNEYALDTLRSDEYLDLSVYATADDFMEALIERYELEEYENDKTLCRNLASVRYNMEMCLFSSTNPYTFAEDLSPEITTIISELSQSMPCIDITTVSKRVCVDGTLMPHILGITGPLSAEEYEENKDKLGNPNVIKPGTTVVIPDIRKYLKSDTDSINIEHAKLKAVEIYAPYQK